MATTHAAATVDFAAGQEYCTFRVGDLLIGTDIRLVEEINRQVEVTPVPHSRDYVRGVINLRGEVVTVVDLRTILGLSRTEITKDSRNVVVNSGGERIALLVDRIGDTVTVEAKNTEPPPANIRGTDAKFFDGVCKLDTELLVLLDVDAALIGDSQNT